VREGKKGALFYGHSYEEIVISYSIAIKICVVNRFTQTRDFLVRIPIRMYRI
jgi:hypothetical protein